MAHILVVKREVGRTQAAGQKVVVHHNFAGLEAGHHTLAVLLRMNILQGLAHFGFVVLMVDSPVLGQDIVQHIPVDHPEEGTLEDHLYIVEAWSLLSQILVLAFLADHDMPHLVEHHTH